MCNALHGAGLLQDVNTFKIVTREASCDVFDDLGLFPAFSATMTSLPVVQMWHHWRMMVNQDVLVLEEDCSLIYTLLGSGWLACGSAGDC